jgi:hypothetical protein
MPIPLFCENHKKVIFDHFFLLDMKATISIFFLRDFLTIKTGKTNFGIFFRKNKSRCQRDGVGLGFEVVSASQIGR